MIEIVESSSASDRLRAASEFVTSFPPGAEILLVGATREAADDLARALSSGRGATFGLHRFSLTALAARLAAADLAGRGLAPATSLGAEALAARSIFDASRDGSIAYFAPVAAFPGFARALARTLAELRLAGVGADALRVLGGPGTALADLLVRFADRLEAAQTADRADLLRAAARAVGEEPGSLPAGAPLLLLDVELASAAERDFVRALAASSSAVLATVPGGDQRTVEALRAIGARPRAVGTTRPEASSLGRLREYVFSSASPGFTEIDRSVRFFSAPGEWREATEIARYVLDEARSGVPFDRMAVFLRGPESYSAHLQTAFRRAGVPAYFARGTKRPDPAGRAFLALIACAAEGLSAKRFSEYVAFGHTPRLDADGAPAPDPEPPWSAPDDEMLGAAARPAATVDTSPSAGETAEAEELPTLPAPWKWEELLVEASVIGSHERWGRRLRGLGKEIELKLEEVRSEDGESPYARRLERQLEELGHLERFALPLVERLAALPAKGSWGEWLAVLGTLAPSALRRPERVLRVLAELEPMASVGPVAIDEVREVLHERLAFLEEDPPAERYGRVFVAAPAHARGRDFAVVFVPGLAERIFPQRPREDPLLPDGERERLDAGLLMQADRGQRERLFLRLAVGAARDRAYLSYPRVDVVEARPRVTSFYGLDVARAVRGSMPDIEEFERAAADEADARLAWPAPRDAARAIDPIEHDLSTLWNLFHHPGSDERKGRARYLFDLNEHLGRSLRGRYARWERPEWSERDGLIRVTEATSEALAAARLTARPYSPSALEKFAACPYRFLLSAIHRLAPRREVAAAEQIDPLTRGRLVHRVQAEALREIEKGGLMPLADATLPQAEAALNAVIDRVAAEFRDELAPPILRVWQDEIAALRADLVTWLRHLAAASALWQPRHAELGFGLPPGEGRDPESAREPAVVAGKMQLRGSIDLVEASPGGAELRVTDHKTGADRSRPGLIVGGGETLQPVLYALAVEATLGVPVREARLFFCTSRGGFAERVVPIDERSRAAGRQVLEIIDRAIADGFLPPAPRDDACKLCDFRVVCGPHEEERLRRKDRRKLLDLAELRALP